MKKTLLLFLTALLTTSLVNAQYIPDMDLSQPEGMQIGVRFHFDANARGFTNRSLLQAYNGAALSSDNVADIASQLRPANNRLGYEVFGEAYVQKSMSGEKFNYWRLSVSHSQLAVANVPGDGVKLLLQGNKQFEGEQIDLEAGFHYQNLQRVSLAFGMPRSENMHTEFGVSLLHGMQRQQIKLDDSWLYTAPYGEYLEAQLNYTSEISGGALSGAGLALHGKAIWEYDESRISVAVSDVGAMAWTNVEHQQIDSLIRFEGVTISNVFNPTELNTENLNVDSLSQFLNVEDRNETKIALAPARLQIQYGRTLSEKVSLDLGAQYIVGFMRLPQWYARAPVKCSDSFVLSPSASFGGFGGWNIGLAADKQWGNLNLHVSTQYLDGLVLGSMKAGLGGTVALTYNL